MFADLTGLVLHVPLHDTSNLSFDMVQALNCFEASGMLAGRSPQGAYAAKRQKYALVGGGSPRRTGFLAAILQFFDK
jgi:hypothetical protein